MRTHFTVALLALLFIATPFVSRAVTNDQLLHQIAQLLAQVQFLQSQLNAVEGGGVQGPVVGVPTTPSTVAAPGGTCVKITKNLKRGSENDEVTKLQRFLAQDRSVYPEAIVSGYYGRLTEAAVERWQIKHSVVSGGTAATTGFGVVGPKTRAALSRNCTGADANEAVHRDLVVTPDRGPLPMQVTATFSLNSSSCSSFVLDWGDGSAPLTFDAGNTTACTKDIVHKRATHTYTTPGVHRVILQAGHGPLSRVRTVSEAFVSVGDTAPTGFSLRPTSGSAPFTTSITFPVVGSTCTSYEADWGDGTIDRHQALYFDACTQDSGTQSLTHTYTAPGTYTVRLKTGNAPIAQLEVNEQWSVIVRDDITPSASVQIQPTAGRAPLVVSVEMLGVGELCTSYSLDWGDGSAVQEYRAESGECDSQVFTKTFTHTYIAPGTYTIRTKLGSQSSLDNLPVNTQRITVGI